MAVDFSTRATDVDSQIAPSATPLNPVTREGEINALNTIGQGIAQGAKTVGAIFRNNAAAASNKYLADFSLKLNSLQDAQDQGLSAQEVRTRSRALLSTSLSNNPNAEEDILKRYSTWLNQSGVDKVATPDIQRYEIEQQQTEAAVKAGFLPASKVGDPAAQERAVSDLENFQRQTTQLEMDAKKINAESARLDLSTKQREVVKQEGEKQVLDGLAKVGQAALPYWRTQYENIKEAAAKAGSEQERQKIIKDGIVQLNTDYAQRTAALSGDGLATNQAKIDQILKPQKDLIDTYIKELDGTYDTEMFKRQSDGAMARAETAALGKLSPKALEWLTLSKSSQGLSAVLAGPIQTEIVEAYARNAQAADESNDTGVGQDQLTVNPNKAKPIDPLPSGDEQTKSVKDYLNSVVTLIDKGSSGLLAEDKVQLDKEIDGQMKSIFRGVSVYSNSVESAKEFQPIVDFLANPTVGKYLQERGGIPVSIRGEVSQVLQDGYEKQVVPLLQTELETLYNEKPGAGVGQIMKGSDIQKAGDMIEPSFENNRFGFKLKEGIEPNRFNDLLIKKVNNSAFSKVFNKMIISNSHVQGNTDYQKSYETLAPEVFGTGEAGSDKQGALTAPDGTPIDKAAYVDPRVNTVQERAQQQNDFDLTDLVEQASTDPAFAGVDASTLEGDVRDIAKAIDIGETGTGDYGTLLGHTNRTGGRFDDADITNKTVNDLLAFSSADGPYGAYTKNKLGKVATPMGRYQIVGRTLRKLKNELGLTGDELFTPELQDRMFLQLLKGRGYQAYKSGELSKKEFIASLQNEWEGLSTSRKSFKTLVASL
jgi:hypothetical protein